MLGLAGFDLGSRLVESFMCVSHLLLLEQDFSPPGALLFSFTRKLSKVFVFGRYLGRFTDDSGGT